MCLIIFSLCTIRTNVCKEMNLYVWCHFVLSVFIILIERIVLLWFLWLKSSSVWWYCPKYMSVWTDKKWHPNEKYLPKPWPTLMLFHFYTIHFTWTELRTHSGICCSIVKKVNKRTIKHVEFTFNTNVANEYFSVNRMEFRTFS